MQMVNRKGVQDSGWIGWWIVCLFPIAAVVFIFWLAGEWQLPVSITLFIIVGILCFSSVCIGSLRDSLKKKK